MDFPFQEFAERAAGKLLNIWTCGLLAGAVCRIICARSPARKAQGF